MNAQRPTWILVSLLAVGILDARGALNWTEHPGWLAAAVTPAGPGKTGFTALLPETTGIRFTNFVSITRHATNQILLNGSGVAAGDLNGDGWCDLVFGGLGGRSAVYRNLGNWRFEDVTVRSGVDLSKLDVTGVLAADLDGDKDLDLVINTVGQGTLIMDNDGNGQFIPSRVSPRLNPGRCGSSSTLADVDGDGDLDLYIANYRVTTMRDEPHQSFTIRDDRGKPRVTAYGNRPITAPDLTNRFKFHYEPTPNGGATVFHDEQGEPDTFYRNAGGGRLVPISSTNKTFLDESGAALAELPTDWGLSAMFRDLNGDQAPDLYVCNDFSTPDRIWMNNGTGRFRPAATFAIRQTSLSSMAVDVADLDRDGFDDIFTADMLSPERWRRLVQINQPNPNLHRFVDLVTRGQAPRNTLQRNRGDGTYAEVAQMAGLEASDWSWASIFLDVDLDGYEDLLVANGFERDFMNMDANRRVRAAQAQVARGEPPTAKLAANRLYPRLATANLAFRNLGNFKFAEAGKAWGFDVVAVSQGMCLADLDNDGDLDVAINNFNSAATVLRNETTSPRVAVRLQGKAPNTRGIGASVRISGGPVTRQSQEIISGGRYLSSDEALRVFAAGDITNRLAIEVIWRSGARSLLTNLPANHIYEILETGSHPPDATQAAAPDVAPLFEDVSGLIDHSHQQLVHDDFGDQPLLPHRMDTLGPGISWIDLDDDGWDDLLVPSGKGGVMAVYRNEQGRFVREKRAALDVALQQSQSTVVGWYETNGVMVLLSGLSQNRTENSTNNSPVREYRLTTGADRVTTPFPLAKSSTGPLALADVDGDGDLDLFVGGRFVPGRWPEPASSALYLRHDGQWMQDTAHSNLFQQVGLVSGALFTDIDDDKDPDLVLSCEWGPVRIFANDRGRFTVADWRITFGAGQPPPGDMATLSKFTGWWNGVNSGDFDGDGRLDLVAANWGRNTKYERFRSRPLRVYFGDFIGDNSVSVMESWFDPSLGKYTPIHDVWLLSRSLPWLLTRFNSYEAFARVSVEEALGKYFAGAQYREAAWLESTVFLNRGDHFEVRALPDVTQEAPAFATCVADFNGDGREDLFLSQNFFGVRPETSRYDAGRGVLLLGNGDGNFAPASGQSGLTIYGEQRGAAVCDFDKDGRVDLAAVQFGGQTKLYHNASAQAGLRVRLRGRLHNGQGIGARLRVKFGRNWGPAREIHAGSGYWSQDSAVQVMARPESITALQIRWPGGQTTETEVGTDVREISVSELPDR